MNPLDDALAIERFENSAAVSYGAEFQYFDEQPAPAFDPQLSLLAVLQWIRNATNARAKEIRLQAAFYFLAGGSTFSKTQEQLAEEVGVEKQTVNQQVIALRTFFEKSNQTIARVSSACGMRSDSARDNMATKCKSNHQKRKALSDSNESVKTSEVSIWRPPTMRELQLQQRAQRSSQPTNAASC